VSTVDGVKAALVALFGSVLPSDVQVLYGPATVPTELADSVVTVGKVTGTSELDSLGVGTTGDDYTVEIIVSVTMPGGDTQQLATQTALGLWGTTRDAVLAHATGDLGVAGVLSAKPVGAWELTEYAGDFGRSAAIRWSVRVKAQGI